MRGDRGVVALQEGVGRELDPQGRAGRGDGGVSGSVAECGVVERGELTDGEGAGGVEAPGQLVDERAERRAAPARRSSKRREGEELGHRGAAGVELPGGARGHGQRGEQSGAA